MAKTLCLRVRKAQGEEAIATAKKLNLFNSDLKIGREEDHLCIPLIRKPQQNELAEIETNLRFFEVIERDLERVEHPLRLVDFLSEKLPPHLVASLPHAIDFVGDIAVVEISPELEDNKALIGKAILAANKRLSTVLAKSSAVKGEYRLREFETIAGIDKTDTVHREHGCVFYVDLAKAYFTPRLSYEHDRVSSQVQEGETILDMFTGVGPFAVHIAKKRANVQVYAVDKNPEAVQLLKKNIIANRVISKIRPIQGDARLIVAEKLKGSIDRIIMNLPEKAIEYVDAACQAVKTEGGVVHYYEFSSSSTPLENAKNGLAKAVKLAGRELEAVTHSRIVRGVAPFTWQVVVDAKIK